MDMVTKTSGPPKYVDPYLQNLNPNEVHTVGGDCINPKCDYTFTPQDKQEIEQFDGAFTCPKCDRSYNYLIDYRDTPGGYTRAGLTMKDMGRIGEQVIAHLGAIPSLGDITWWAQDYHSPIDFLIGPFGCEVKTNHSEASPRFKVGGAAEREAKIQMAKSLGAIPSILGVRLNFYTDTADVFFRPQLTDTWIGNPALRHVAKVGFRDLNPYKHPHDVPPSNNLPDDDSTPAKNNPEDQFPFQISQWFMGIFCYWFRSLGNSSSFDQTDSNYL